MQLRLRLVALHVVEVVEALISLRMGRGLRRGQHPRKFQSDQDCVLHLVLGRAWVDVHPVEVHARVGRVEVLVLQLAQLAAIHSVGHRRAEALHVEMVGTLPNLLVRGEAHGNAAVGSSGCWSKYSTADIISATPALSSAPSRVVPSVTISS